MTTQTDKPRLMIIIASTRPSRKGGQIGSWVNDKAVADGRFEIDLADLADLSLPMMNEPNHPRERNYQHDHTKAWSARVDAADAFVFVTPEYNHSYNAALKNAIDYLSQEWGHKPVGFVSYGGVAGGARAVGGLRPVLAVLKMVPITEGVTMQAFTQYFDDEGRFQPTDRLEENLAEMFASLERWIGALSTLRSA